MYTYVCTYGGFGGLVTKSCLTLATPWTVAHQAPRSMAILQEKILKWIAISFSRCVYACVCKYLCVYPCVYMCVYIPMHVYTCVYLFIYLEWVAFPFSRGTSPPRDWTQVSCIAGGFFTNWAIREACVYLYIDVLHAHFCISHKDNMKVTVWNKWAVIYENRSIHVCDSTSTHPTDLRTLFS